jgi:hypothetical protein
MLNALPSLRKHELGVSQHRRHATNLPIFATSNVVYDGSSILIREGVMSNSNQSGSNQGGKAQSGQNQSSQQPSQQHTQHSDRKGQPGSQQGSNNPQSGSNQGGSNDRDRPRDKGDRSSR